ncbi:GNAT family N-acetyltransferase [Demequina aurantiaca]|uniref:GNAT family N-acetyltransferase n=1 Tax=Demequina aurantiaca TaxID=676200 RepID=UPI00078049D6|nr:GNAT family N-acetyltransferase [Demequina aurantiaca]
MASTDGYEPLDLTPDRWDDIVDLDEWAFLNPWLPEERRAFKSAFPWDRGRGMAIADPTLGEPGTLVAIRASFPLEMVVPGGERVPTSALSWVGVHPGHRRRGLLTSMMRDHFERSLARGEYISALGAAEPQIYQRFGYGVAAWHARAKFSRGAELRDVPGTAELNVRLEKLTADDHSDLMADLQRRVTRPGAMVRDSVHLAREVFASDVNERREEEGLRIAVVSDASNEALAYAIFKRKAKWVGNVSNGSVTVNEFVTTTGAASRRLWGVLFDLDLTDDIHVESLPLDDRLMWLAMDQRAPKAVIEDDLWVRILDVPRALEARTYESPVDMVIEVTDYHVPANAGRWRITTEPMFTSDFDDGTDDAVAGSPDADGGIQLAHVAKVGESDNDAAHLPDLSIGIQELSAAYLGGVTVQTLTEAGLVLEHTPGASRLLSVAMQSPQAPMSSFQF